MHRAQTGGTYPEYFDALLESALNNLTKAFHAVFTLPYYSLPFYVSFYLSIGRIGRPVLPSSEQDELEVASRDIFRAPSSNESEVRFAEWYRSGKRRSGYRLLCRMR